MSKTSSSKSDVVISVHYWWPTFADLLQEEFEQRDVQKQSTGGNTSLGSFYEILVSRQGSLGQVVVFLEPETYEMWAAAESYFRGRFGTTWPSLDQLILQKVPSRTESNPYAGLAEFLKERLADFIMRFPKAKHRFIWSIGDPVLEVVIHLLRSDLFPELDLVRVVERNEEKPAIIDQAQNQIPFEVFARLRSEHVETTVNRYLSGIIAESHAMMTAVNKAKAYAAFRKPVLILGETGTGKEVIARLIHESSGARGRFLTLNCSAIPKDLLESELFGSMEGAYYGAGNRAGLFEEAHEGTIFLDEFGELRLDHQAKILRVLQDRKVRRLGSTRDIEIDIQLVTATNANLRCMVETNEFRRDLYYRINVGRIILPPLRERPEDALALAKNLVINMKPPRELTPEAEAWIVRQRWPGNFREVQNLFDRVEIEVSAPYQISEIDLERLSDEDSEVSVTQVDHELPSYVNKKRTMERAQIIAVLRASATSREAAKKLVPSPSPSTFSKRLKALGIDASEFLTKK